MWSLPDINRLNEEAIKKYELTKNKTEEQLCLGIQCEFCEKREATHALEYYDIFSDTPKGHIFICDNCLKLHGEVPEGYFYCNRCDRLHIDNYTWELYYTHDWEGGTICLNCALDQEIENDNNWIMKVRDVTWNRVRSSKHLIPVGGKHWTEKLTFIGNTELDSMTGAKLTGFSSSPTIEDGLKELKGLVGYALKKSDRCILILDAAYQFSVSIGVYIEKKGMLKNG